MRTRLAQILPLRHEICPVIDQTRLPLFAHDYGTRRVMGKERHPGSG